ncbi:MAG: hypothetical protein AMJ92_09060 [candidate division Zixibacteria bacterium SM23_81]|nr:MAG: hypothetical protein AMJ92_09060 [candidate division Zixibacteria bacterium SM23_81]
MCCGQPHHAGLLGWGAHRSECLCFSRRFISSAEEKERLERYQEQLKKELAGIEEQLKKKSR